jgi:transposase-like protein
MWKSHCPLCNTSNNVYVYDTGIKFWRRFIVGNNRFACGKCKVTWRRKNPHFHLLLPNDLQRKDGTL